MVQTSFNKREQFMNTVLDRQEPGLTYGRGRLYTRESPDGDGIQLVAYGAENIAELDGSDVDFYIGHHGSVSRTVTSYIKLFGSVLSQSSGFHPVIHRDKSPQNGYTLRQLNAAAARFIDNYVGGFGEGELSDVEEDAVETVEEALRQILDVEFGDEE